MKTITYGEIILNEDYKLSKDLIMDQYGINITRDNYDLMNSTVNGALPNLTSGELYDIFEDVIYPHFINE